MRLPTGFPPTWRGSARFLHREGPGGRLAADHVKGFGARCIEGPQMVDHVPEFDAIIRPRGGVRRASCIERALVVDHVMGFGARCIEAALVVDHVQGFDAPPDRFPAHEAGFGALPASRGPWWSAGGRPREGFRRSLHGTRLGARARAGVRRSYCIGRQLLVTRARKYVPIPNRFLQIYGVFIIITARGLREIFSNETIPRAQSFELDARQAIFDCIRWSNRTSKVVLNRMK
jgi:hypothetical protein